MLFRTYSHRNAETLFTYDERYQSLYNEVCDALYSISDKDIVDEFNVINRTSKKSISQPINTLIKDRLVALKWKPESPIFEDPEYNSGIDKKKWRLDFAKEEISIEVAFNHGEAIAWNLLKPIMASELNHVKKAVQTSAGILICATADMKNAGNFDNAVGEYEKIVRYLKPMYSVLTSPLLVIGLEAPDSFYVDHETREIVIKDNLNLSKFEE